MKFLTILLIIPLLAAGCQLPWKQQSPTENTKATNYYQVLGYSKSTKSFFPPEPYDQSFVAKDDYFLPDDQSWTPDGKHRLYIEFTPGSAEGVSLRLEEVSSRKITNYALGPKETLTEAKEDEAGWPVVNINYDNTKGRIIYSVYERTEEMPVLGLHGGISPNPRRLVEKRIIKL